MKYVIPISITILSIAGFFVFGHASKSQDRDLRVVIPDVVVPQEIVLEHIVAEDETFATIVEEFGIGYEQMSTILESTSSTYDFTRVRIGQPLRFVANVDGSFNRLEYERGTEDSVLVRLVDGVYIAEIVPIQYDVTEMLAKGVIENSLYVSALDAGVKEAIILEFAEAWGWTIDFATQVQSGDRFIILYEKRTRDGKDAGVGRVLAGEFTNGETSYDGYLFEDADGKPAYYNGNGEAMVKQFLKAPLSYNRITSGFTYARFHPVTQQTGPHLAIDYAAPIGTPIRAVGDGVIRRAGWNGGYGNAIDIHHNDVYDTRYAHLSSFAKGIRAGVRVEQGQVIGYVGSTGWSTGPHLHYEIHKFGTPVNPLLIELPPGDPVAEEKKEAFEMVKKKYQESL